MHANEKEWSAIWQLKVPSKIRLFLWRLARHSIPTADVLHRRHMIEQAACFICGAEDSWKHSLLECNMAKCVWALSNEEVVEHMCNIQEQNPRHWLAEIISSLHERNSRGWLSLCGLFGMRSARRSMRGSFRVLYRRTALWRDSWLI